jgi:hypothetical protein
MSLGDNKTSVTKSSYDFLSLKYNIPANNVSLEELFHYSYWDLRRRSSVQNVELETFLLCMYKIKEIEAWDTLSKPV